MAHKNQQTMFEDMFKVFEVIISLRRQKIKHQKKKYKSKYKAKDIAEKLTEMGFKKTNGTPITHINVIYVQSYVHEHKRLMEMRAQLDKKLEEMKHVSN